LVTKDTRRHEQIETRKIDSLAALSNRTPPRSQVQLTGFCQEVLHVGLEVSLDSAVSIDDPLRRVMHHPTKTRDELIPSFLELLQILLTDLHGCLELRDGRAGGGESRAKRREFRALLAALLKRTVVRPSAARPESLGPVFVPLALQRLALHLKLASGAIDAFGSNLGTRHEALLSRRDRFADRAIPVATNAFNVSAFSGAVLPHTMQPPSEIRCANT
jgi:hypothetical protein